METLLGLSLYTFLFLLFLPFALQIFLTVFVYKDAQKRGMDSAVAWAILVFFTSFPGVLVYVLCRRDMSFNICPSCGKQLLPQWTSCPFCAPSRRRTAAPVRKATEPLAEAAAKQAHPGTRRLEVEEGPLAYLIVRDGKRRGKEFRIKVDSTKIGSAGGSDVVIEDDSVSAEHAKIKVENGNYEIWDLGSTNGTRVNDRKVTKKWIKEGDSIEMGHTKMIFSAEGPPSEALEYKHKPSDLLKI